MLGQVRQAWEVARDESACGPVLGGAFRHALQVGKRARTETTISRGTTSLSYAAVELADRTCWAGWTVSRPSFSALGEVGAVTARAFADVPGGLPVLVANRTRARAEQRGRSGRRAGGAVGTNWPPPWPSADVVACCTAGRSGGGLPEQPGPERGGHPGPGRPLLLVDLAVPRDIDPAVADAARRHPPRTWTTSALSWPARLGERRAEVPAVERIVAEELDRYNASLAARAVAPLVTRLHDRAEEVRRGRSCPPGKPAAAN